MDDCLCDCGGCDGCSECGDCCGDCGDCGNCDCGDCCGGFLLGLCAGSACCETKSSKSRTVGQNNGCAIFAIIGGILAIALICFFIFKPSEKKSPQEELTTYKIVEVQREWRIFGQDGNTILENMKTGERKTVIGKRGKVGEEIKLKD